MKKILTGAFMLAMIMGSYAYASQNVVSKLVTIPPNTQGWTYSYDTTRTTNFSYVSERCVAIDGKRSTIATAIFNGNMAKISNEYILSENSDENATFTNVVIKEGYLSTTNIYIGFHGTANTSASYEAWVKYKTN